LQELEYGFLSEKSSKKLEKLTDDLEKGKEFATQKYFKPTSGTKLRRLYNGIDYEVEAVENGFIFEGQQYKSLSAIANKITGTHWNGLKFFGLKK
jgi:endonuclease YncB( thermonuclease family)